MQEPTWPSAEDDLQWDTASSFSINADTPWDILCAQLLWAIWCQRVVHAFSEEVFLLGVALRNAWRNTIYCTIEAYNELFRHKRNEQKRQEIISCFQQIWTVADIFGRLNGNDIEWNVTPHTAFLPRELGAWMVPPIRIHRLSPSPDPEAEFTTHTDFPDLVSELVNNIGNNWHPPVHNAAEVPTSPRQSPSPDSSAAEFFNHTVQPQPSNAPTQIARTSNQNGPESASHKPTSLSPTPQRPRNRPKRRCRRSKPLHSIVEEPARGEQHPYQFT